MASTDRSAALLQSLAQALEDADGLGREDVALRIHQAMVALDPMLGQLGDEPPTVD